MAIHYVERRLKLVAPDGGWGWVVVVASFFTGCLIGTMGMLFSLILEDLLVAMDTTTTTVSWIPSTHLFLSFFCTPLASAVSLRFSNRKTAIVGGLLYFTSLFSSFFVTNIGVLILTFGVLGGLGAAFAFPPMLFAISEYFDKRRGRVTGIYMSGMSFGRFSFAIILQVVINQYGFRGAFLIMSAIMLNVCVCGCLLQPVNWHFKPLKETNSIETSSDKVESDFTKTTEITVLEKESTKENATKYPGLVSKYGTVKLLNTDPAHVPNNTNKTVCQKFWSAMRLDLSVFQNQCFFIVCVSNIINVCVFPYVLAFMPALFLTKGYEPLSSAMLLSVMALCEICGRLFTPWIVDCNIMSTAAVLMVSSFIFATLLWALTLFRDYYVDIVVCAFGGLLSGGLITTNMIAVADVLGPQKLPSVMAFVKFAQSFFTLAMGPLLGFARDCTGKFETVFMILSFVQYCSVLVWLLEPYANKTAPLQLKR